MPKSFQPVSGFDLPRFAGVPTFMRLPYVPLDDKILVKFKLDLLELLGILGQPIDRDQGMDLAN